MIKNKPYQVCSCDNSTNLISNIIVQQMIKTYATKHILFFVGRHTYCNTIWRYEIAATAGYITFHYSVRPLQPLLLHVTNRLWSSIVYTLTLSPLLPRKLTATRVKKELLPQPNHCHTPTHFSKLDYLNTHLSLSLSLPLPFPTTNPIISPRPIPNHKQEHQIQKPWRWWHT